MTSSPQIPAIQKTTFANLMRDSYRWRRKIVQRVPPERPWAMLLADDVNNGGTSNDDEEAAPARKSSKVGGLVSIPVAAQVATK